MRSRRWGAFRVATLQVGSPLGSVLACPSPPFFRVAAFLGCLGIAGFGKFIRKSRTEICNHTSMRFLDENIGKQLPHPQVVNRQAFRNPFLTNGEPIPRCLAESLVIVGGPPPSLGKFRSRRFFEPHKFSKLRTLFHALISPNCSRRGGK